jgi:hypothetical protein
MRSLPSSFDPGYLEKTVKENTNRKVPDLQKIHSTYHFVLLSGSWEKRLVLGILKAVSLLPGERGPSFESTAAAAEHFDHSVS